MVDWPPEISQYSVGRAVLVHKKVCCVRDVLQLVNFHTEFLVFKNVFNIFFLCFSQISLFQTGDCCLKKLLKVEEGRQIDVKI